MIRINHFFHKNTSTFTYVVIDENTKHALIIDPVLDLDAPSGTLSYQALNDLIDFVEQEKFHVQAILDTHVHADHVTGAHYLRERWRVPSVIGEGFIKTQHYFKEIYGIDVTHYPEAYNVKLAHKQDASFGSFKLKALATPGHTPACTALLLEDALFSGDTLFQPNLGCGRADFPGGSARDLFLSITRQIFPLPDETRIFVGHDYPKELKAPVPETSVVESKKNNILINEAVPEAQFIAEREKRDKTLALPNLMLLAMQINILGGQIPTGGFLKLPVKTNAAAL